MSQTHYRRVFKSDHLSVADLEDFIESGKKLIFNISHVKQELGVKVAGRKIDANIAYFVEDIKPLVLNAGNSKIMRELAGSVYVENWRDITVELYVDHSAMLKGEVVGGVRVSPRKVKNKRPNITKESAKMWENAKRAFIRDGNFNSVLSRADISKENQDKMIAEVNNA